MGISVIAASFRQQTWRVEILHTVPAKTQCH
jgi:hypothetical protein